ncbi:hypothetical protein SUGI_0172940 [Cryptomeria japonica]|uniref:protein THYLAKOID ASSEMBLY 8-like, chloroplastic n=1 Tax=Cryptomeria japonica TaxID=3369 RepID=UPI002408D8FD|nr:protein THYLAKOID ASSEMBLY 8-like, chloroplastic [Cryptomeria japonica]GLJ11617.1 hypothetical protein SUGI_0172940 [Cryptomeria japonica]
MAMSRGNLGRVLMKCAQVAFGHGVGAENNALGRFKYSIFTDITYWTGFGINSLKSRGMSDGRPRGALWRSRKLISKEALFVVQEIKRVKHDAALLTSFMKTHVSRLLKVDLLAVLVELERQGEITLTLKIFDAIKNEPWYKPDVFLFKDMIIVLAKHKKMEEAMQVWKDMRSGKLEPDIPTYTEVIRGFLQYGSPTDAMNIYEEMKQSPHPPEELPYRVLLKGLFPNPLLRNKVKQDFEETFPDRHVYDPPEELFGMH